MHSPVIIGGGVIGLSIGWHLTRLGVKPVLFDKGEAGSGASGAAAGMIAPASEVRFGEEELLELFLESHRQYPAFINDLEQASATSIDFNARGSLLIAIDPDDREELLRLYNYQKELGLPVRLLDTGQALKAEPLLSPHFSLAVEADQEYFLDSRRLIQALKKAFILGGGILVENRAVTGIQIKENRIQAIQTSGETLPARQVILATGVDTHLAGLPESFHLPLRPVKGQALDLRGGGLSRAVRTIHRYPAYLVPRSDGRITVGATSEEMGLDRRVTAGAQMDLLYGAWKVLPAIEDMEIVKTRVGFRPASRDHSPILGPTAIDGLSVAMGMYRHGILLTPLVGRLLAGLVAEGRHSKFFERFTWERFKTTKTVFGN